MYLETEINNMIQLHNMFCKIQKAFTRLDFTGTGYDFRFVGFI